MPRQATVGALQDFAERDPERLPPIDYDAEYRVLDLAPGTALREIQDGARLLFVAFDPAGLPGSLQVPAAERAMQVALAADRLSQYWRTHGAPPPGGPAAPAVERLAPRLELVAETMAPQVGSGTSRRTGREQSAALRAAVVSRRVREAGMDRPKEAQQRRPLAVAGSLVVKLALAGLVVAAVVRVQQYRAAHPSLSPYSDPRRVTVVGMPADPPVRWAGLDVLGRQVIGAAAPAIAGHRRQD